MKTAIVLIMLVSVGPLFAYLDPGTGSMALQAIIAAFLGFAFTMKLYLKKITGFIKSRFQKKEESENDPKKAG